MSLKKSIMNEQSLFVALDELATQGWSEAHELFPLDYCVHLAHECQNLHTAGKMNKSAIGRGISRTIESEIRGDDIFWLESHPFFENLDFILQALNESFFLGLKQFETHFAFYPPGTGYEKHLDNPRGQNNRKITFLLYLNEKWQETDGGKLVLYRPQELNKIICKIAPKLGTFILFRSDLFPHEVETSKANRCSLTGWFRDDKL
jgi:SM-20-related protein